MDGYQFVAAIIASVAQIIDSLALPGALVAIFWIFRAQIGAMLPELRSLRHIKTPWGEASFAEDLEEAARTSARIASPDEAEDEGQKAATRPITIQEMAEASPASVVLMSWEQVETLIMRLASASHLLVIGPEDEISGLIDAFFEKGTLSVELATLLRDLRNLRNKAAHGRVLDRLRTEEAMSYYRLSNKACAQLAELVDQQHLAKN